MNMNYRCSLVRAGTFALLLGALGLVSAPKAQSAGTCADVKGPNKKGGPGEWISQTTLPNAACRSGSARNCTLLSIPFRKSGKFPHLCEIPEFTFTCVCTKSGVGARPTVRPGDFCTDVGVTGFEIVNGATRAVPGNPPFGTFKCLQIFREPKLCANTKNNC